ncbi:MAG TPA: ChbG/HpnK family deacetylase [Pirellulales bacterium]|nr:ChbG/HpnK family deacetylase [Pirellulales bacterium]
MRRRHDAGASAGGGPRVVLHADDLGLNAAVNAGILQSARQGLLTSTSLLANGPQAAAALAAWKELLELQRSGELPSSAARRRLEDPNQPFDLGIHLNLTQGRPLTAGRYPAELLDREGRFPGPAALFRRLCGRSTPFAARIEAELAAQIEFMLDHGAKPTHLNGHQYMEIMPALAAVIPRLVQKYALPAIRLPLERNAWLVSFRPGFRCANAGLALVKRFYAERFRRVVERAGMAHPDAFFGSSHAGCVSLSLLERFLARPQRFSLAEIALHPGAESPASPGEPDGWSDPLSAARPHELAMLLSPALEELLARRGLKLGRVGAQQAPISAAQERLSSANSFSI